MNKYAHTLAVLLVITLATILILSQVGRDNLAKQEAEEQEKIIEAELIEKAMKDDATEIAKENEITVGLNVGNYAPEFKLKTLDGETKQLSDYRGKVVFMNFWGSWCPPCRAEMPDLEKLHNETDVVVLGVNLTGGESKKHNIQAFVDEFGLTFPILLDEDLKVAERYSIKPIPTSYLIDADGVIQNMAFGPLTYDMMIEEYERISNKETNNSEEE